MQNLLLSLDRPADNLRLDESLLASAEAQELRGGVLRVWESPVYAVVLGRSSSPEQEVRLDACRRDGVSIERRVSGGASVVVGPGCLMYSVVQETSATAKLANVSSAHDGVLDRMAGALRRLMPTVVRAGTSDLAFTSGEDAALRKFSGNSLRLKRTHLLYHGTLLYDFQLERIERWLRLPKRQPTYRDGRTHERFVANVPLTRQQLVEAIVRGWQAEAPLADWPRAKEFGSLRCDGDASSNRVGR